MDTTQLMDATKLSGEISMLASAAIAWATVALPRLIGALLLLIVGW